MEIYQDRLVASGLIPHDANAQGWTREEVEDAFTDLNQVFSSALTRFNEEFAAAIGSARDAVGLALAHVMLSIRPEELSFEEVAARFLESMLEQGYGPLMPAMLAHFLWRGIDPSPFLQFRPVPLPGRSMRRAGRFSVQISPRHGGCAGCSPGGALHASQMIRAAHANGGHRRKVSG